MAQNNKQRHYAVIGAGIAGLACARTLERAGRRVTLLEKNDRPGGRMAALETPFGSFDHGMQYFTVRDARLTQAMQVAPEASKRWSANAVRVLDAFGQAIEAPLPGGEAHWVGAPDMAALPIAWAEPLRQRGALALGNRVQQIVRNAGGWALLVERSDGSQRTLDGFDAVALALPAALACDLLRASGLLPKVVEQVSAVQVAPCWSLMLAYPQAVQPGLTRFGPQWNAARSTHHRLTWLSRESSKPGRGAIERWTAQASADWSQEHLEDDQARVLAKLKKAFAEVTGIRIEPSHAEVHRWRHARTLAPLGKSHLWDGRARIGLAGDWCLGHRMEDAFVSGLELALAAL